MIKLEMNELSADKLQMNKLGISNIEMKEFVIIELIIKLSEQMNWESLK